MSVKSYAFCPVSEKTVNERVARINGVLTVILLIVAVLTKSIIPVVFLTIDFLIRASDYSRYSLIGISSKGIVNYLRLNEHIINAGPKLFAARIGFIFCSLILISLIFKLYQPALALTGILGLFSFLEGVFGLCVACVIYPFLYKLLYGAKYN